MGYIENQMSAILSQNMKWCWCCAVTHSPSYTSNYSYIVQLEDFFHDACIRNNHCQAWSQIQSGYWSIFFCHVLENTWHMKTLMIAKIFWQEWYASQDRNLPGYVNYPLNHMTITLNLLFFCGNNIIQLFLIPKNLLFNHLNN